MLDTSPARISLGRDLRGQEIDLSAIEALLSQLVATWRPTQIWLFGSRARGDGRPESDWDLFAVVPDDVPEEELGPLASWRLRKQSQRRADVVACHASEFADNRDTPNTLSYAVSREGVLLYEC